MNEDRAYPLERLFGKMLSPFELFMKRTTAGGIVLIAATAAALLLASTMGAERFHHFWSKPAGLSAGSLALSMSLHHWVNDGLMALFFLLVGLELKREILVGELASLRAAALAVVAAIGGMVMPAAIYLLFNAGTGTASGWGVPMATDIAFAVGILVMMESRVPRNLVVFLTALAIADDLGAVLVIAIFYSGGLHYGALLAAAGLFGLLALFNRVGIRNVVPYGIVGILLWFAVHESGIHATIAGILLAFAIPARPSHTSAQFERRIAELHGEFRADRRDEATPDDALANHRMASIAGAMEHASEAVQSPVQRIAHTLGPWVTFMVIPIFALSNAGIDLSVIQWSAALADKVTIGVVAGLVLGKFLGITLFSYAAVRAGIARLPEGVRWPHLCGAAWLAGIGFTMSIFIAQLAFTDPHALEQAKLGIIVGSALAAALGLAWLHVASGRRGPVTVTP